MGASRSRISRVREYFKTADFDEVEVVIKLVQQDIEKRVAKTAKVTTAIAEGRPPRSRSRKASPGTVLVQTEPTPSVQEGQFAEPGAKNAAVAGA